MLVNCSGGRCLRCACPPVSSLCPPYQTGNISSLFLLPSLFFFSSDSRSCLTSHLVLSHAQTGDFGIYLPCARFHFAILHISSHPCNYGRQSAHPSFWAGSFFPALLRQRGRTFSSFLARINILTTASFNSSRCLSIVLVRVLFPPASPPSSSELTFQCRDLAQQPRRL